MRLSPLLRIRPEARLGLQPSALQPLADRAVLEIVALAPRASPLRPTPRSQSPAGRAEPRRLRAQLRQAELFPEPARALHVFALRQRERRQLFLHRRVHEQRRILVAPLRARARGRVPGLR